MSFFEIILLISELNGAAFPESGRLDGPKSENPNWERYFDKPAFFKYRLVTLDPVKNNV
tara:strand:+ start:748 stop:924 length:177 start_codon:yes stop_codon:yes gene_type:complete